MEASMKWRFPVFGPFVVLAVCLFALPIRAQTTETTTKTAGHPWYDMSKEVTLTGTVSSVVKSPTREMKLVMGSHLMLETSSGAVDASLGKYAMRGEGALSVTTGERVQVTGIMKTVGDKQVFFARVVLANGHAYAIRNEHGFQVASRARKGATNSTAKGGQL
jgi:hypothetical protein